MFAYETNAQYYEMDLEDQSAQDKLNLLSHQLENFLDWAKNQKKSS